MKSKYKVDYGAFLVFAGTSEFVKKVKEISIEKELKISTEYMQIIKRDSEMGKVLSRYFLKKVV